MKNPHLIILTFTMLFLVGIPKIQACHLHKGNNCKQMAFGILNPANVHGLAASRDSLSKVIVSVNEEDLSISIKVFIYPAHDDSVHLEAVQSIKTYWNEQSGRHAYQIKSQGKKHLYRIKFDIRIPEGSFNENGMFIPYGAIPGRYLNRVEVVDGNKMPSLKGLGTSHVQLGGYAPPNAIYLATTHATNSLVAAHEMGHQLGLGHSQSGVMATEVYMLSDGISPISLKHLFLQKEMMASLQYKFFLEKNLHFSVHELQKARIKRIEKR